MIAALVLLVSLGGLVVTFVGLLVSIAAWLILMKWIGLFMAKLAVGGLVLMVVMTACFQLLGSG